MKHKLRETNIQKNKPKNSNSLLKIGSYTILILLVITFVGAPILSNNIGQQSNPIFGKYASFEIKYLPSNYFGQAVQSLLERYSRQISENSNSSFFTSTAWKEAFDESVLHYALLDIAKQSRYAPTQAKVIEEIKEYPFLQTDGVFDKEIFDSYPDTTKQDILDFQTEVSTTTKIRTDILNPSYINSNEIEFITEMNSNRRAFNFVRFSKSETQDKEFLRNYGKEHSDKFQTIEFKSITVDAEKDAQSIHEKLLNQETTFEESVTSFSIDSASAANGERGILYAFQVESNDGADALEALRNLKNDESISEVITTSAGSYAIYSLMSEVEEADFSQAALAQSADSNAENNALEDDAESRTSVLTVVQEYLNTYEPGIIEDHIFETAENFIDQANTSGFSKIAEALDLELGDIPLAPLNVDNVSVLDSIRSSDDSPGLSSLESNEDILAELFALATVETISKPYALSNYIYVFELSEIETQFDPSTLETEEAADDSSTENDFRNRINYFTANANYDMLRDAVVSENKLTDNFNKAFKSIYNTE